MFSSSINPSGGTFSLYLINRNRYPQLFGFLINSNVDSIYWWRSKMRNFNVSKPKVLSLNVTPFTTSAFRSPWHDPMDPSTCGGWRESDFPQHATRILVAIVTLQKTRWSEHVRSWTWRPWFGIGAGQRPLGRSTDIWSAMQAPRNHNLTKSSWLVNGW